MFTEVQAQVGSYNRLPCLSGRRLFGGMSKGILDLSEAFAERLQEQVVPAPEMLVKPPWVRPASFITAETAAPLKPSARTRREASFTIF